MPTFHVSATPEQLAIIDELAEAERAARREEKPNRSRTLVDLALAEHERRRQKRDKAKR